MIRRHLVLFARSPQLGVGKRRLAQDVGDVAALRFERAMLGLLCRRLGCSGRWRMQLVVTPESAVLRRRLWPARVRIFPQGGGDLGMRMQRALAACPSGPVILVGSDIPDLASSHVAAAFGLLGRHDLVFGPAADGGFWLVGVRHPRALPAILKEVRWSGPHALADALAGLPRRLSVGFAARLADVDDGPSYHQGRPRRGF